MPGVSSEEWAAHAGASGPTLYLRRYWSNREASSEKLIASVFAEMEMGLPTICD